MSSLTKIVLDPERVNDLKIIQSLMLNCYRFAKTFLINQLIEINVSKYFNYF